MPLRLGPRERASRTPSCWCLPCGPEQWTVPESPRPSHPARFTRRNPTARALVRKLRTLRFGSRPEGGFYGCCDCLGRGSRRGSLRG